MLSHHRHPIRAILLIVVMLTIGMPVSLFTTNLTTRAQEDETAIIVAGSVYMEELFNNMLRVYQEATGVAPNFQIEAEGNNDGFMRLCDGSATITMSTRRITDEEILACDNSAVQFVELVVALDGLVLVANAESGLSCLAVENLSRIFQQDVAPNWSVLTPNAPDTAINLYGGPASGRAYSILTALLDNNEPSVQYTVFENPADVIEPLQDPDNNILAFMTLAEWSSLQNTGNAQLVEFSSQAQPECTPATSLTLSSGEYPPARLLMLYVNAASLEQIEIRNFLQYGFGEGEAAIEARPLTSILNSLGFTVPPQAIYDRDLNNVRGPIAGRTFTRGDSPLTINTAVAGELTIAGAGLAEYATRPIYNSFNQEFASITIKQTPFGNDTAWSAFCAGETPIIQVTRVATAEELEACETNGVNPYEVPLGAEAVVFVVKAESELPICMNYEQISTLIVRQDLTGLTAPTESPEVTPTPEATPSESEVEATATGEATPIESEAESTPAEGSETSADEEPSPTQPAAVQGPARWNEVEASWPDLPILLLVPPVGALETDIVLSHVAPGPRLRRSDSPVVQETPANSLLDDLTYRLGGLLNAEDGAIAYLFWSDFQASNINDQLRLLEIDSGSGCVGPDERTFADSSYPFAFGATLVFSEKALADPLVAALLWHTHSRAALDALEALHLTGFDRSAFDMRRDALFTLIENAQVIETETPEATPSETPAAESTEAAGEDTEGETNSTEATATPGSDTEGEETTTAEPTLEPEVTATPAQ